MPRIVCTVLQAWALVMLSPLPSFAEDWPQWRGPYASGVSRQTHWRKSFGDQAPPLLWQRQIGVGYSAAYISNGRLYTAGRSDGQTTICCLDTAADKVLWTYASSIGQYDLMHLGGPGATPATDGKRVYMLSREEELICLDAVSGDLLWSKKLMQLYGLSKPKWAFTGSPRLDDKAVYVDVGRIIALDKIAGRQLWKTRDYEPTPLPCLLFWETATCWKRFPSSAW